MGGGASSIMMSGSPRADGAASNEQAVDANNAALERRLRRQRIFEKGEANPELDINELLHGDHIDESTRKVLIDALGGFYFLQGGGKDSKVDMLLRAMQKEEIEAGELLIQEGEPGSKLYIVESGELEVTINGEKIRDMGKGSMLGELALLYDAPRSATVQCMTKCVLWSLRREVFKQIQAVSSSTVSMQRARWLISSPDLAILSAIDLSRLVGTLQTSPFETNELLYKEGKATTSICLIERGVGHVYTSKDMSAASKEEIDKQLGIIRPLRNAETARQGSFEGLLPAAGVASDLGFYACTVGEGCLLGIDALRAKAKLPDAWKWQTDDAGKEGAISPFTVSAAEPLSCSIFTVEVFENLFGPCAEALKSGGGDKSVTKTLSSNAIDAGKQTQELIFDSTKFKLKYVLGSGSFGVVTFAEYTDPVTKTTTGYALKSLSKATVIETGQLRHVMDERRLLSLMNSRFVLKLHGTYQTPHQLVMVTEPLDCGDLWSVIYETYPYNENDGLTVTLMCFYAASLVLALSHVHKQGIVFRDLKPENIMLDNTGYLRVIDFGFAKKVPYTSEDPNTGEVKVHAKTYTLCGTPEYLSPELIFNLGHDQSSDLWALGVLIYEMVMASTPFAPKKADNVTELFTNIAMVTKSGLHLSSRLDNKTRDPEVRSIISQLLKAEPSERIGVQEGSTSKILDHPFFSTIDLNQLKNGTLAPEFVPEPQSYHEPISTLKPVKAFSGDQKQFKNF